VSLRSCLSYESCTDGSLRAKTTMALTLPCQCCCSMKSILRTIAITNSSSEMLSTTMAVQRLYYNYTVSDDRVAKGKLATYDGSTLLRELCPGRSCLAPQRNHQHCRNCHEQTSNDTALGNELVQSFGAQSV